MKDIFFEIMQDVLEDRILYGYDCTPGPDDGKEIKGVLKMSRRLAIKRVVQVDMDKLTDYYIIDSSMEHMELRSVYTIALPRDPEARRKWALGRVFYEIKEKE